MWFYLHNTKGSQKSINFERRDVENGLAYIPSANFQQDSSQLVTHRKPCKVWSYRGI